MMRLQLARILQIVGFLVALALLAPSVGAGEADLLADRSLGEATAPVTIIEYSSLTCPHCAVFHEDVLPQIKSAYIDSGKVRLIFRDFPLDPRALAAAMLARCVEPARYFGFIALLFKDQQVWARSEDPVHDLKLRAQLASLSPQAADACLANQDLAKAIEQSARQANSAHGIDSTPSFLINDRLLRGEQSFANFRAAIETALLGKSASPPSSAPEAPPAGAADASGETGFFGKIKGAVRRLFGGE